MMRFAITALLLTAAYVGLAIVNRPAAEGAGWFYLASVMILMLVQRATERGDR